MPYGSIIDLLDDIQNGIPKRARQIYKESYNNAWDEYEDSGGRHGLKNRKFTAHRAAWNAVENEYEKGDDGSWHKKG